MMSGFTSLGGGAGWAGSRRAKNLPALVMTTSSSFSIYAAARAKSFRRSLTVAVFIVIQKGITTLMLSMRSPTGRPQEDRSCVGVAAHSIGDKVGKSGK